MPLLGPARVESLCGLRRSEHRLPESPVPALERNPAPTANAANVNQLLRRTNHKMQTTAAGTATAIWSRGVQGNGVLYLWPAPSALSGLRLPGIAGGRPAAFLDLGSCCESVVACSSRWTVGRFDSARADHVILTIL